MTGGRPAAPAYPACLLRSHAPLSSGTKGAEVVCVTSSLAFSYQGRGESPALARLCGFLPAQE